MPITEEEIVSIRRYPQKTVDFPIYSKQKAGIIAYSIILLLVVIVFFLGVFLNMSFHFLMLIPLVNSHNLLNIFAVIGDGVISGGRFIAWSKINSFQFIPIDINHKYYGYSKEVNDGYELKIVAKGHSVNCIVTTGEMREKLNNVLARHVAANQQSE